MSETINASMSTSGYTIEFVRDMITTLDNARATVKAHPDKYDVESTIAYLDARIKKWGMKLTEMTLAQNGSV